jgi:hypothetical protein
MDDAGIWSFASLPLIGNRPFIGNIAANRIFGTNHPGLRSRASIGINRINASNRTPGDERLH